MSPFFMSVVSDSDVWLFAGSNGPFTAGRGDADRAMFPYQTVDKILRLSREWWVAQGSNEMEVAVVPR